MGTKSIIVKLSRESQGQLKRNYYSLCFAKKVNDVYNVVWKSYSRYLSNTTFRWKPEYGVFGTNTYVNADTVMTETDVVPVELGQKCILNEVGVMEDTMNCDYKNGITIMNQYGPIHTGICQGYILSNEHVVSPIYVSKESQVIGDIFLVPKDEVMVWFQKDVQTGTIFEEIQNNAIEVDLTDRDEQTISYDFESGKWMFF